MFFLQTFFIISFGVVLSTSSPPSTNAEEAELQVLQGTNRFAFNLYKVLAAETKDNVFFSPISAHVALSMAYQGARGTTAQRLAETLHVPDAQIAADGYNTVMTRLNSVQNVTLAMANRVYLKQGAKLVENFKNALTNKFQSEVQLLDFGNSEESAKIINVWVEKQTHGKIKDLIKKGDLDALTTLVLVNAIYFKGTWKLKFNKELTKSEPFYLNDVDKVDVEMMHINGYFSHNNDKALDAQILRIPYSNKDLSMIIILPNKRNGIKELEEKLVNVNFTEITRAMWPKEVNLSLPRFKCEQTIDLQKPLTKLGLEEIFGNANFTGIIEHDNLSVSKALQKAFIEVNEEGTEAAAVTVIEFTRMARQRQETFTADHPFIFILSEGTSTHLFMGRLFNPNL